MATAATGVYLSIRLPGSEPRMPEQGLGRRLRGHIWSWKHRAQSKLHVVESQLPLGADRYPPAKPCLFSLPKQCHPLWAKYVSARDCGDTSHPDQHSAVPFPSSKGAAEADSQVTQDIIETWVFTGSTDKNGTLQRRAKVAIAGQQPRPDAGQYAEP